MLKHKLTEENDDTIEAQNIIESVPFNCILVGSDGCVNYINQSAINALKKVERHFDKKIDDWKGNSIWSFHKNLEPWRKNFKEIMLENKKVVIDVGMTNLYFGVRRAEFCKKIDNFLVVVESFKQNIQPTEKNNFSVKDLMEYGEMLQKISFGVEALASKIKTVDGVSKEAGAGFMSVNSDINKMAENIVTVKRSHGLVGESLGNVMTLTKNLKDMMELLDKSSPPGGDVVAVVSSISQQANLLALNATIEAARAGEAGRGFSAVAQEIKNLSQQTNQVSRDFAKTIESVSATGKEAAKVLEKIISAGKEIERRDYEQKNRLNEFSRIVNGAVKGMEKVDKNINDVSRNISNTSDEISVAHKTVRDLKECADKLYKCFE